MSSTIDLTKLPGDGDNETSPKPIFDKIMSACRTNRANFTRLWRLNYPKLAGFPEHDLPKAERNMSDGTPVSNSSKGQVRCAVSFNLVRQYYQRLVGRAMPVITNYQVMASSTDQTDIDAALVSGELLKARTSVDSGKDFEETVRAISYMFGGGPSYMLVEPLEEFGGKKDVALTAILPFDVYYYPGIFDIQKSPAIVLVQRLTKQQIEDQFPELADAIAAKDDAKRDSRWSAIPGAKWPEGIDYDRVAPEIASGLYEVRRLMIRPCRDFPKGREIVMINGEEKSRADYPELRTRDKHYPLEACMDIPMGPFMEDIGRMSVSRRMQNMFDELMGRIADVTIENAAVYRGLPPGMDPDDLTNDAVNTYERRGPGGDVTLQAAPGIGSLGEAASLVHSLMDEQHSQSGPSRGQLPGPRTSGRAMDSAITADEQGDNPMLAMLRRWMGRVGKRILLEGQGVWDKEYVFQVLGQNNRFERHAFEKANLKDGFDVRVLPDNGLPRNKASRLKLMIDANKNGLMEDNPAARRTRSALGIAVDDDSLNVEAAEKALIKQEDEMIDSGVEVPINWSDDHSLHLHDHKKHNVERLAHGAPQEEQGKEMWISARMYSEAHSALHSNELAKAMQAQLGIAAGEQGGGQGAAPAQ